VIVLVGFMGAGKSTVGRRLAQRIDVPFVDSDDEIVARSGRAIADVFRQDGEPVFRALEQSVVLDLLAGADAVVALGGGAVETPAVREALTGHDVVYLAVTLEQALARVGGDGQRPVLNDPALAQRFSTRAPLYGQVATVTLDAGDATPDDLVDQVVARLGL